MEELELTSPVVIPEMVIEKYRVVSLSLSLEHVSRTTNEIGLIAIELKDNNDERFNHTYTGPDAVSMIKFLNTANLTIKSMHKRILEKLSNDGILPGTVIGAPDQ